MRIYVLCLLLLVGPTAMVYWYKAHYLPELENAQRAPTKAEVLFFNASWCGPCKQMKPIVKNLRRQGYRLRDVDIDRQQKLAQQYGIRAVPTFVFLEDGSEVDRISGGINSAQAANASAAAAAAAPSADIPEKIAALAALRDQGHITAAEFEAKKAELLERM